MGRLIIGFRKEWLAEIKGTLDEHKLWYKEVALDQLDGRGVIEAISGPSKVPRLHHQIELQIDDGLPEQIATDLLRDSKSVVAPTLQILLSRMWKSATNRPGKPIFTHAFYEDLRDEGMLLSDILNQQIESIKKNPEFPGPPDLLLDVLALHTTSVSTAE